MSSKVNDVFLKNFNNMSLLRNYFFVVILCRASPINLFPTINLQFAILSTGDLERRYFHFKNNSSIEKSEGVYCNKKADTLLVVFMHSRIILLR